MYALILQAAAPAEARARLAARGIAVRGGSGAFEIDPAATFGARLLVEGSEARVFPPRRRALRRARAGIPPADARAAERAHRQSQPQPSCLRTNSSARASQ